MRVVRILTRPNVGGPTRQVAALWREQRALGIRTLLVVGRCGAGETAVDLEREGVPRLAPEAAADPAAEGHFVLPELGRGLRPLADRRAARLLRALLAAARPQVVHTHTSKAGWLGRRAAVAAGVPVVAHTFHGIVLRDYYAGPVAWLLAAVERSLARRSDLLFAVSPSCRDELAELGIAPAERIEVTPPAVELAPFARTERDAARARLGLGAAEFALGFVGRLVRIKRPELFAALLRRTPDATGLLFGDGPLGAALDGAPRLRRLGARADLADLLAGLDVLVIPSTREGCPLAALEAFAAGVPVVGFDVPGVRDVLGAWGAGLLVPPAAGVGGLAAAVARLRAEPSLAGELRARARAGLGRHAPAAVAAQLAAAYERALQRRTR
jgi:glycosyltransferase involved in cell wall biosynthesis